MILYDTIHKIQTGKNSSVVLEVKVSVYPWGGSGRQEGRIVLMPKGSPRVFLWMWFLDLGAGHVGVFTLSKFTKKTQTKDYKLINMFWLSD